MKVSLIVGMDRNGVIGKSNNTLPWNIPEDMTWFKEYTTNKAILMGKNTWDSIGRCLPNRTNIVLSKTTAVDQAGNALTVNSFNAAVNMAKFFNHKEMVIIGGKQMYETIGMMMADKLVLTIIDEEYEGDVKLEIPFIDSVRKGISEYHNTLSLAELVKLQLDNRSSDSLGHTWKLISQETVKSSKGPVLHFIIFEKETQRNY